IAPVSRARVLSGTHASWRGERDRFHDVLRGRFWLRRDSVLSAAADQPESRVVILLADGRRHPRGRGGNSLWNIERSLHFLSAAPRASRVLHRTNAWSCRFLDRVLQLAPAVLRLET